MKIIVILIIVGIASVGMGIFLNSEFNWIKSDCDIQKDQIFIMGERFQEIRKLQESPDTDNQILDEEFQKLTIQALEKRNWYIANCL